MAIIGSLSTIRAQAVRHPSFEKAYAYLEEIFRPGSEAQKRLLAVDIGKSNRVELGDGIFALEQAYNTKAASEGKWESHIKYIDIQAIVVGEENLHVAEISHLTVTENMTPAKDIIFYQPYADGTPVRLKAGEAAILLPPDGHLPGVKVKDSVVVRKSVIKLPVF